MPKTPVEIPLFGGRFVAVVDPEDVGQVTRYSWHALRRGHTRYAKATLRSAEDPKGGTILMHRLILGVVDPGIQVDHRDGDGLNNRRSNLRICSREENLRYTRLRSDSRTGLKGVGFNARLNRYHARIFVNKKSVYLGSFETAEEAHAAYCRAAEIHYREFARFK